MQLSYLQTTPYLLELRETADAALHQLAQFDAEAELWLEANSRLSEAVRPDDEFDRDLWTETLTQSGTYQTRIFDALEAFLAAFARVSLLLFPVETKSGDTFREQRGEQLRALLCLKYPERIESRALRDSWMHFDERIDTAVQSGKWGNRQRFVLSTEAAASVENTLRLIEVDERVVHYRNRHGEPCSARLDALREALLDLQSDLPASWERARKTLRRSEAG